MKLAWARKNDNLTTLQSVHIEVRRTAHSIVATTIHSSTVENEAFGDGLALGCPKGRFFVKVSQKTLFLMLMSAESEETADEMGLAVAIRVSGALYQP